MQDLESWSALIRKNPQNFLIGSDAVGRFGACPEQIRIYDALFDALGDKSLVEARGRVGGNADHWATGGLNPVSKTGGGVGPTPSLPWGCPPP